MDGCIEKGCVVSRAMHEALAMFNENPNVFIFINKLNVQSVSATHTSPADSPLAKTLPSVDKEDLKIVPESAGAAVQSPVAKETGPVNSSRRRALLVDDVMVTQRLTSRALEKSGYLCDLASDGQMAVEFYKKNKYFVVLMDVQLPVLNGVEATMQIRQFEEESGREPCIIFGLTGNCSDEALKQYSISGMDGCIEKGSVVSRAMHEALAMLEANPSVFLFIDCKNAHFQVLKKDKDESSDVDMDAPDEEEKK